MIKSTLLFIFSIGFTIQNKSCRKVEEGIIWDEHKKLTLNDFKGEKIFRKGLKAKSIIAFSITYKVKRRLSFFDVKCLFIPKQSFCIDTSRYVIDHEQGHFDIGEIYARQFRNAIFEVKDKINESNSYLIESIYNTYFNKMTYCQMEYDKETLSPVDSTSQLEWYAKIKKDLDSLSRYSREKFRF